MELFDELSEDNFMLYAVRQYYKPNCIDAEEFYNDMKRFMYLKRLFYRYKNTGEVSERLILNHLIVLFNVFDIKPTLKMLEYQIEDKYWSALKPFLIFLNYIKNDEYTDIKMDQSVIDKLRKI
jgi:hypothetical protein